MHGQQRPGTKGEQEGAVVEPPPLSPGARSSEEPGDDWQGERDPSDRDRQRVRVGEADERSRDRDGQDRDEKDDRGMLSAVGSASDVRERVRCRTGAILEDLDHPLGVASRVAPHVGEERVEIGHQLVELIVQRLIGEQLGGEAVARR